MLMLLIPMLMLMLHYLLPFIYFILSNCTSWKKKGIEMLSFFVGLENVYVFHSISTDIRQSRMWSLCVCMCVCLSVCSWTLFFLYHLFYLFTFDTWMARFWMAFFPFYTYMPKQKKKNTKIGSPSSSVQSRDNTGLFK